MDRQLYAAGQNVQIVPESLSGPRTDERFEIVRRYLIDRQPPMYHVRGVVSRGGRMVPENELVPAMPTVIDQTGRPTNVLRLFPDVVHLDRRVRP